MRVWSSNRIIVKADDLSKINAARGRWLALWPNLKKKMADSNNNRVIIYVAFSTNKLHWFFLDNQSHGRFWFFNKRREKEKWLNGKWLRLVVYCHNFDQQRWEQGAMYFYSHTSNRWYLIKKLGSLLKYQYVSFKSWKLLMIEQLRVKDFFLKSKFIVCKWKDKSNWFSKKKKNVSFKDERLTWLIISAEPNIPRVPPKLCNMHQINGWP